MVETINRGPNVSLGSLTDSRVELLDGPVIAYQAEAFPDPRFTPAAKDGTSPARVPAFMLSPQSIVVDNVPSASSTSAVAAAQAPSTTQGVALNLVTAVTGTSSGPVCAAGVPIIPFGSSVATTVMAIDFGFATGTTTANSSTVAVADNTIFQVGQWLVIGGAGSVSNQALITQVASVSGANLTTIFISPVAGSTSNNLPIGQGNLYGNLLPSSPGASIGPQTGSAFAAEPYQQAGLAKMFDPRQAIARNVVIASVSTTSGTGSFLVKGYDLYGQPMSELIAATASPGGIGKKAFKYIQSIAVQTTATTGTPSNIGVGLGTLVGFPLRNNKWEYLDIFWAGAFTITNAGWTAAVTGTATNTTGDVRGTQNLASAVIGSTGSNGSALVTGANRVTINQAVEQASMLLATPISNSSLFGFPQA